MTHKALSKLVNTDWADAWVKRYEDRPAPGDSIYWDERSKDFKEHAGISAYTDIFIDLLDLTPHETVFDMGSGPGTIAIPLAEAGHEVISADFSKGMRDAAEERARQRGLTNMRVMALDWNDSWPEQGIAYKSVDVAIASRSTMVEDLGDILEKLDKTARKKVALTMVTEYGPRGFKPRGSRQDGEEEYIADYIYCLNILFQMGAYPELRYIDTTHGHGGDQEGRLVRWAFISWTPVSE